MEYDKETVTDFENEFHSQVLNAMAFVLKYDQRDQLAKLFSHILVYLESNMIEEKVRNQYRLNTS